MFIPIYVYYIFKGKGGHNVKYSEFRRWLISQGATIEKAKGGGSHRKIALNGKRSVFPDHGSKEMPEPLRKKILKDLGL